ncbi:MAG: hypothetical protein KA715_12945 [Xanthomonadaceae bacterium]|nr:hypothetical protein [Xanthomonadaceae bacterium]
MNISTLINRLIWLGLGLGWSGTIIDVTEQLMHGASKQHIMSLGKWNRQLLGERRHK